MHFFDRFEFAFRRYLLQCHHDDGKIIDVRPSTAPRLHPFCDDVSARDAQQAVAGERVRRTRENYPRHHA